jgi:hypothetical protein
MSVQIEVNSATEQHADRQGTGGRAGLSGPIQVVPGPGRVQLLMNAVSHVLGNDSARMRREVQARLAESH